MGWNFCCLSRFGIGRKKKGGGGKGKDRAGRQTPAGGGRWPLIAPPSPQSKRGLPIEISIYHKREKSFFGAFERKSFRKSQKNGEIFGFGKEMKFRSRNLKRGKFCFDFEKWEIMALVYVSEGEGVGGSLIWEAGGEIDLGGGVEGF